jgi:CubicO group peptidase (beta-lactamase class C family)
VHQLLQQPGTTLSVLDGQQTVFPAGERFAYNNGGYVLPAKLAERANEVHLHRLVRDLVCEPAGMVDSEFLRSDELPGRAALGYLYVDGLRTNVSEPTRLCAADRRSGMERDGGSDPYCASR